VANLAYRKDITCRFTFDEWETISEVTAVFLQSSRAANGISQDYFAFTIDLDCIANLDTKMLQFCIRYRVNSQELWDNNSNKNFQVQFDSVPTHDGGAPDGNIPDSSINIQPNQEILDNTKIKLNKNEHGTLSFPYDLITSATNIASEESCERYKTSQEITSCSGGPLMEFDSRCGVTKARHTVNFPAKFTRPSYHSPSYEKFIRAYCFVSPLIRTFFVLEGGGWIAVS
jgi:hypothetical protein